MARKIQYKVYYRPIGSFFWRCLKNVYEDGLIPNTNNRFFTLSNDERVELPGNCTEVRFSKERVEAIEEVNRQEREKVLGRSTI